MYLEKAFTRPSILLILIWLATSTSCNRKQNHTSDTSLNDSAKYDLMMAKADALTHEYKLDSAYSELLKIYDWALQTNDSIIIARSLTQLGNINRSDVNMIIAEKHLDEAIAILRRHNNPKLLAEALENAGLVKQSQANYKASQQLLFESLEIAEMHKDYERACRLLNQIGANFDISGDTSKALAYFHRGVYLAEKHRLEKAKYSIFNNLGVAYRRFKPDSAEYYYKKVIDSPLSSSEILMRLRAEFNLGNIHFDHGNYKEALSAYEHVHKLSLEHKIPEGIAISISGIAVIYDKQNKAEKAIQLLKEAIIYFEKTGNTDIVLRLKQNMIECHRTLGNYMEIDRLYSSIIHLQDSLKDASKAVNIQNLEFFYQSKKKELINKQLATELRFAKLSSAFWLVIFLVVSCFSAAMLAYFQKKLEQKHRSLRDLEERVRAEEKLRHSKSQHAEILEKQILEKQEELSSLSKQLSLLLEEIKSPKGSNSTAPKDAPSAIDDGSPLKGKNYWENLTMKFNILYPGFTDKLLESYPNLNSNDIQFCLLIKLNLPLKDIANILNISQYSLYKRKYRLAEKIKLHGEERDLYYVIQNIK